MIMLYFADLDILLKLAACDLLTEVRTHWHVPPNQCFVEERFQCTLKTSITRKGNYTNETLKRVEVFLQQHTISITFDDSRETIRLDEAGIDTGERRLIIATKEPAQKSQPFFLATGDKRAIKALAALPSTDAVCQAILSRLQKRVICLEQMILDLINAYGFDKIKQKVLASRHNEKYAADFALTAAFGSGDRAQEHNVRARLQSYISDLPAQLLK